MKNWDVTLVASTVVVTAAALEVNAAGALVFWRNVVPDGSDTPVSLVWTSYPAGQWLKVQQVEG